MTKNWPDFIRPPETVDRLMVVLEDEHKAVIASLHEEDLIGFHSGLDTAIRNAFGLYGPDSKLLASCGAAHPDDASGVIIRQLWNKLNE